MSVCAFSCATCVASADAMARMRGARTRCSHTCINRSTVARDVSVVRCPRRARNRAMGLPALAAGASAFACMHVLSPNASHGSVVTPTEPCGVVFASPTPMVG
jgi:hypothetical protein